MSRIVLPRRTFLKGVGGASLALPLMSSLGCTPDEQRRIEKVSSAQQRAGQFPKRFIFVYTANGNDLRKAVQAIIAREKAAEQSKRK